MRSDSRVQYTKERLNDSLVSLLQEIPINRVTVTDICKRAKINRSTYYKYYADPYDQLDKLRELFLKGLDDYLIAEGPPEYIENSFQVFNYFKMNRDLMLVLYNCDGGLSFRKYLLERYSDEYDTLFEYLKFSYNKKTGVYIKECLVANSLLIVCKWLEEDMDKISLYEIQELFKRLQFW